MTEEIYGREKNDTRTILSGAGVSSGEAGRRQVGVIVGPADPTAQDYQANTVRSVEYTTDIASKFGSGSPLAVELEAARYNGADQRDLRGVAVGETAVTDETVTTDADGNGTLANAPLKASVSDITATATTDGTELTVDLVYESLPTQPADGADTVAVNPNSGELAGPASTDLTVSYAYYDAEPALTAGGESITVGDVGGIYSMLPGSSATTTLEEIVDEGTPDTPGLSIRQDYRLAFGLAPAEPNVTNTAGDPALDAQNYACPHDNDALFVVGGAHIGSATQPANATPFTAPLATRTPGVPATTLGGVFGRMLGNAKTTPIYEDTVEGYGEVALTQQFSYDEAQTLREEGVIPMLGPRSNATNLPQIGGNTSTSSATDYVRDYHRLTIKDNVTLNMRNVAEAARREILVTGEDGVINETEQYALDVFRQLADRNIILGQQKQQGQQGQSSALARTQPAENAGTPAEGDGAAQDQQRPYDARVSRGDTDELVLEYQYVPTPIVKHVTAYGTISDSVPVPASGSGGA